MWAMDFCHNDHTFLALKFSGYFWVLFLSLLFCRCACVVVADCVVGELRGGRFRADLNVCMLRHGGTGDRHIQGIAHKRRSCLMDSLQPYLKLQMQEAVDDCCHGDGGFQSSNRKTTVVGIGRLWLCNRHASLFQSEHWKTISIIFLKKCS